MEQILAEILETLTSLKVVSQDPTQTIQDSGPNPTPINNVDVFRQVATAQVIPTQHQSKLSPSSLSDIAAAISELQTYGKLEPEISEQVLAELGKNEPQIRQASITDIRTIPKFSSEPGSKFQKAPLTSKTSPPVIHGQELSQAELESLQTKLVVQLRQLYNLKNQVKLTEEQQADTIETLDLKISQYQADIQTLGHEIESDAIALDTTQQQLNQSAEDWDISIDQQLSSHQAWLKFILEDSQLLPIQTQQGLVNDLISNTAQTLSSIELSQIQLTQSLDVEGSQLHPDNYSEIIQQLKTINDDLTPLLSQEEGPSSSSADILEELKTVNLQLQLQENHQKTTQGVLNTLETDNLQDWIHLKQNISQDFQQRSTHWATRLAEGHTQTKRSLMDFSNEPNHLIL